MPEDKDESSGFKVIDRRGFSSDGTRREDAAENVKVPEARPAPAPEPPPQASVEDEEPGDFGPPGFDTIVSYLSTTALFQMGLLAGPGGQLIPPDLANARRTVDMLEVLQHKTRGNLTVGESQLLEEVLYELRMSYVEVQKRLTQAPR